jgi:hypothetical protein
MPVRNERPRDLLGRPLPYGTPGVARQPEGVVRSPAESLRLAQQLLDDGLPFHAHEVLEDAWKNGPDVERGLWRGLAQLAVGLTHALRGNQVGAVALLRRGCVELVGFAGAGVPARAATHTDGAAGLGSGSGPHGIDILGLLAWAEEAIGRIEAAGLTPASVDPVDVHPAGTEAAGIALSPPILTIPFR